MSRSRECAAFLWQYRIIWQEQFARIFCLRMRRVFAAILDVLQESARKSGGKISAKRRRHNCAVLPYINPMVRRINSVAVSVTALSAVLSTTMDAESTWSPPMFLAIT